VGIISPIPTVFSSVAAAGAKREEDTMRTRQFASDERRREAPVAARGRGGAGDGSPAASRRLAPALPAWWRTTGTRGRSTPPLATLGTADRPRHNQAPDRSG